MINYDDTIAAIATPPGRGAIGIVRVAGSESINIIERIFRAASGIKLNSAASHNLIFGKIFDEAVLVDEVLVAVMRAPKSYSGDDTVEVFCHGGNVVLQKILNLIVNGGARLAEPGEFTRRAFINGKIDLTQAEAVAELINAPTELARRAAVVQLEGKLKKPLEEIKKLLIDIISGIEAEIEFPDDVDSEEKDLLFKKLDLVSIAAKNLLKNADTGRILHDGFRVAIAGKPNAGKSSLLNRLAKEERALVTDIPGTTRDTLEVDVNIEGFPVRFIDTAGLRSAKGKIEQQGIKRAKQTIANSDIVIWVCDISKKIVLEEDLLTKDLKSDANIILAFNKCDLEEKITSTFYEKLNKKFQCLKISAMTGSGIDNLHNLLAAELKKKKFVAEDDVVLLKVRHVNLLERTIEIIEKTIKNLKTKMLPELIVLDLRDALKAVGEITGDVTTEDLLDKIFSDFCIGK